MTKVKATSINNIGEFQCAIDDLAIDTITLAERRVALEKAIAAVRESHSAGIDAIESRIKTSLKDIETFANKNRAALFPTEKKSSQTALAEYGYRLGNPTLVTLNRKWKWDTVFQEVKNKQDLARSIIATSKDPAEIKDAQKWLDLIVTKEDLDKDRIKAVLKDVDLTSIGCKINQPESFWIEPKHEAVAEKRLTAGK